MNTKIKKLAKTKRSEDLNRKTFKNVRNYIVEQQAVFVALLNKYAAITISRPIKKSTMTQQRIKIESISFPKETIDINDLVKQRSFTLYENDLKNGIPHKTAIRRLTQYKIMENQHLLSDILFEIGFRFTTYFTLGKNNTPKTEIVSSISKDGLLFTKPKIIQIGNKINEYFCSSLKKEKSVTFSRNDDFLQSFLL